MKKLLFIPVLLTGTLLFSEQKMIEISPMLGYNMVEGDFKIKDNEYSLLGLELQFNALDTKISPEFSFLYTEGVDYTSGENTQIVRSAVNAIYTAVETPYFTPFSKAGVGFERVSNETLSMKSGFFLDIAAGVKVPLNNFLSLKLEATYIAKIINSERGTIDNNFLLMAGLSFSFGNENTIDFPLEEFIPRPRPIPQKKVETNLIVEPITIKAVDGDDDNDTILNSKDKCPSTKYGVEIDEVGCAVDMDEDGVLNDLDICPHTLPDTDVNSDGCPQTIPLSISFENNSVKITAQSKDYIHEYATFLMKYTNYRVKVIGYTDNIGEIAYNQKLSEKRAQTVVDALLAEGVSKYQLLSEGGGEFNPIADNKTEEGRAKNRRIEVELTRY